MLSDARIDQFAAMTLESSQGASLILADEATVTRDIGGEDGRKPALDALCFQGALPNPADTGDPVVLKLLRARARIQPSPSGRLLLPLPAEHSPGVE